MPLYGHDDRTITETDTSSGWLPGLSLGALRLAFSVSGDGWGGHPGDVSVSLMKSPCIHIYLIQCLNTLRPRQDGCLFADDILKCIFLNLNSWIPNKISWKYVAWRLIDNKPSMFQIMGCRRAGDNPIVWTIDGVYYETRPRWVRDGDRGDHPGDIYVSVIISLLYSYLLYTVLYEHHSYCRFMRLFTLIIVLINIIFYLCVLKCLYILPLYILCIYSFMYWKSGTSDLLVLMLFVLQCTDYK